jgi:hypothetical protein
MPKVSMVGSRNERLFCCEHLHRCFEPHIRPRHLRGKQLSRISVSFRKKPSPNCERRLSNLKLLQEEWDLTEACEECITSAD